MDITLHCRSCGKEYKANEKVWRCDCGGLLDIRTSNQFQPELIDKSDHSIWRYKNFLPVNAPDKISFGEGLTPLIKERKKRFFKLDYISPTGSFKDRGASVLVSKMKELGIQKVVEDSSGNAGKAIAAYCSQAEISCEIIVPKNTPESKLLQIKNTDVEINIVDGNREQAATVALKRANDTYYASHVWNPYFFQGTKTIAYEIFEQMENFPERIIIPVGNGTLLIGIYLGLIELQKGGYLEDFPAVVGVQPENCAPLVEAFRDNKNRIITDGWCPSIAKGISVAAPARSRQILNFTRKYNGQLVAVTEKKIADAHQNLLRRGYLIETTAAAGYAGYLKFFNDRKNTLIILTGKQ